MRRFRHVLTTWICKYHSSQSPNTLARNNTLKSSNSCSSGTVECATTVERKYA